MSLLSNINELREVTRDNHTGEITGLKSFETFFDRIINLEQVFYYNRFDQYEWFQTLTECIDKGVPPKGFDFFIERNKLDIFAVYLAFKRLGLKSLILRQEFNPEPSFNIDDEEILNNTNNAPIEPFSYLLLYKQSDIAKIANQINEFGQYAEEYKQQLKNDEELVKQVTNEQFKYFIFATNQNKKDEEYIKAKEEWDRQKSAVWAVLRSKAASPPWVDPWRWPRYKFRPTILYGNPFYKGTTEDLSPDAQKEIENLKQYKQVKQKIKSNKLKGR